MTTTICVYIPRMYFLNNAPHDQGFPQSPRLTKVNHKSISLVWNRSTVCVLWTRREERRRRRTDDGSSGLCWPSHCILYMPGWAQHKRRKGVARKLNYLWGRKVMGPLDQPMCKIERERESYFIYMYISAYNIFAITHEGEPMLMRIKAQRAKIADELQTTSDWLT